MKFEGYKIAENKWLLYEDDYDEACKYGNGKRRVIRTKTKDDGFYDELITPETVVDDEDKDWNLADNEFKIEIPGNVKDVYCDKFDKELVKKCRDLLYDRLALALSDEDTGDLRMDAKSTSHYNEGFINPREVLKRFKKVSEQTFGDL